MPVTAPPGFPAEQAHGYTFNGNAGTEVTLHSNGNPAVTYVPSVFDVAHDHGKRTAMFATKTKFNVYSNSYNTAGAPDLIGQDDGNEKIDVVEINTDAEAMSQAVIANLKTNPPNLSFIHFNQPDVAGHPTSWGGAGYQAAVELVDRQLAKILDAVVESDLMRGRTAVILTTDHGGTGYSHLDSSNKDNFVIPFCLVGPGVPGGANLYTLVEDFRAAPLGDHNPGYEAERQPIRNGDSGNLALELLGLPPVPGSLMHPFGIGWPKPLAD